MPASTTDDFLTFTVGDDVLDIADPECTPGTRVYDTARRIVDRRTQYMRLSATINNRLVCGADAGPSSIVLLAARTKDTFRPLAQW